MRGEDDRDFAETREMKWGRDTDLVGIAPPLLTFVFVLRCVIMDSEI